LRRWIDGFANRFGLTYIDYKNATLPRYPKRSSKWYAEYVRTHYSYDSSDPAGSGDDGNYYNDDYESSGAVGAHTSNSTSSGSSSGGGGGGGSENEGASRHKKNKRKKNDEKNKNKKGKGKGKDKGKRKGKGKGKGNSKNQNDDRGPILPVDDDYTLDPKNELFKGGVSAPLRDQAKRMVAVSSVGGFMDFLNAAMGSNHGAAVFGPQGLVPW
jgi:Glycosyl hydrolase family 1